MKEVLEGINHWNGITLSAWALFKLQGVSGPHLFVLLQFAAVGWDGFHQAVVDEAV